MGHLDGREMQAAGEAARKVFDEIGLRSRQPFNSRLEARTLIYPIDYTMLSRDQFDAVADAASSEGDESAYLVPYGSLEQAWGGTYDHRLIDLEFDDYRSNDELVLEHLIYSLGGTWGVVTSHGDFAIAGGTQRFIDRLLAKLVADETEMARAFFRDWADLGERGGADVRWLDPLMSHIFGKSKARELAADA